LCFSYVCAYFVPDIRLNCYTVTHFHATAYANSFSHTLASAHLNCHTAVHFHSFFYAFISTPHHTLMVAVSA
jgi:hypothetical protein